MYSASSGFYCGYGLGGCSFRSAERLKGFLRFSKIILGNLQQREKDGPISLIKPRKAVA